MTRQRLHSLPRRRSTCAHPSSTRPAEPLNRHLIADVDRHQILTEFDGTVVPLPNKWQRRLGIDVVVGQHGQLRLHLDQHRP